MDLPELVEVVVDTNGEEELGIEVDDLIDVKGLVVYLELVLDLHIFGQVKILDPLLIGERLNAKEQEEHVEVDHSEDLDVLRPV